MRYRKIAVRILVTLLVAGALGVSAHATYAGGVPHTISSSLQEIAQALPIPGWQQVNSNGFGDPRELEVSALEVFNAYLYAGTYNVVDPMTIFDGARIFRSPDGATWTPVTQPGFQDPHDSAPPAILDFVVFGNRLYASTGRGGNPAQVWRSSNGVNWAPMVAAGFGDPDIHDIGALAEYNGMIYAGASSQVSGARIFRSSSGDSNTWNLVTPAGPTMPGASVTGFVVFNGALWATIESEAPVQIWRSTGGAWTTAVNNGFGNSLTTSIGGMAVFGGYLYVGAGNSAVGAQLWRSNNGTSWVQAINPGFGDSNNHKIEMVSVFQNHLYVSAKNAVTGMEVWRSADGTLWEQINQDGFGDRNNSGTNGSHATADFLSQLYAGTSNPVDGGELWRMLPLLNSPPTDISLSNTTVDENQPINTVVGALTATDPDAGATFTFSVACAAAGVDDASFNILGTNLRTSASFDYITKSMYNICLRVTDQGGLTFDKNFVVTVNNLNEAPTDISLSNATVDENQPVNTVVGALTATDPDAGASATVYMYTGGVGMTGSPFMLGPGASTRVSFAGVNSGPVQIDGTNAIPILGAERVIYKVNGLPTSFSEIMGLPNSQLDTTYWLPWYNNVDLDTQLRFGNVSNSAATVHVFIGGAEMTGSPFALAAGASVRKSFAGINNGPVKIESNRNIVAAERLIYKVNGLPTSFSEMMGLPNTQLDTTYWLPWYNNVDLDTQLRFGNVSNSAATVHVFIGGAEMTGSPFALAAGASVRKSFAGINNGPVKIVSDEIIVAAERVIYKVNGLPTSFSEMMGLPNSQLNTTYLMPWYNNVDLDTQLRFGNVSGSTTTVRVFIGGAEMTGSPFALAAGASVRKSFAGINNGPVKIESDEIIVAAERVIYKVNDLPTSFSEMMGLPNTQLDTDYWLPWYNNVDLDTQLRFGNVSDVAFTFSLACAAAGVDDASFNILGTNLRTSASFDYETKSTYNICLRVMDQGGLTFDKNFVVTVNNLNEATNTPGKVLSKLRLADPFSIFIPGMNGYTVASPLTGGNLMIQKQHRLCRTQKNIYWRTK